VAKNHIMVNPSKTKMAPCSAMRRIFWVGGGPFQVSFEPCHCTLSDTQEVHLGEENSIISTDVFIVIKKLKSAMKSDQKCLKALNRRFL